MANNNTLKSDIRQYIYSNQNEEITGNILRDVLLEMVDSLGDGWTYKGVATTSTNPGTPDNNVFYIATAPGTYTNFGGLSVADGEVAILKYNGTWTKEVTGAATAAQVTQLGQDLDGLEQRTNGQSATFESGAINYLNGNDTTDAKSIRCGHISIIQDVEVEFSSDKVVSTIYVVKYLGGVYAGYTSITVNAQNASFTIAKDSTFDSFRIRATASTNWTSAEIASSIVMVYGPNSLTKRVAGAVKYDDVKMTYSPTDTNKYANLGGISVGQTYTFVATVSNNYAYWVVPCNEGDIFILTTVSNTANAKSYCILDGDNKVLEFVQAAQTDTQIIIPSTGKTLIVNSRIASGDVYLVENKLGRLVTQLSFDELIKQVNKLDAENVEQIGGFEIGSVNYLTGVNASSTKSLRTDFIPVSQNFTIRLYSERYITNVYCVKYLGNTYAGYSSITLNGNLLYWELAKDDTFDSVRIRADVTGTDLTLLEASGASWGCFVTGSLAISIDRLQNGLYGQTAGFKHYKIDNFDNDFSFDKLGVLLGQVNLLRFYPNFSVPTDGAYMSTDIDNTKVLTEPLSDEEVMKSSVPYLYVNGEKRGTIVLYDTDGTPFIYDKDGNKRTLNLN